MPGHKLKVESKGLKATTNGKRSRDDLDATPSTDDGGNCSSSSTPPPLTLDTARALQLTRDDIKWLVCKEETSVGKTLLKFILGLVVKVLLEEDDGSQGYRLGVVQGLEDSSEEYSLAESDVKTKWNVLVAFCSRAGSPLGAKKKDCRHIAPVSVVSRLSLNVVSNGPVQEEELEIFNEAGQTLGDSRTRDDMAMSIEHIRYAKANSVAAVPPKPLPTAAEVRHGVLADLRDQYEVFPVVVPEPGISVPGDTRPPEVSTYATVGGIRSEITTQSVRTLERDLLEYLQMVRGAIEANTPSCVVCQVSAPVVISLPCRHQILCRLCAPQVKRCPMCRETLVEMFTPIEL